MIKVPFHKPLITESEISAVAEVARSGWLTTGPKKHRLNLLILDGYPVRLVAGREIEFGVSFREFYERMSGHFGAVSVALPHMDSYGGRKLNIVKRGGITYHLLPFFADPIDFFLRLPLDLIHTLIGLWRALSGCDVCLLRFPSPVLPLIYLLARLRGKGVVLFVMGTWVDTVKNIRPSFSGLIKKAAVMSYECLHGFLIKRHYTITTHPYLELGLENVGFGFLSALRKEDFLSEPRKRSHIKNILFAGRLTEAKGVFVLLDAFEGLVRKGFDLRLHIAGDGYLKEEIRKRLRKSGIEEKVILHGHRNWEGMRELYRQSDAFVLPSFTEGAPKVVFEAMANRLPVIAARVGALPMLFKQGVHLEFAEAGSPESLMGGLRHIIEDASYANRLSENAFAECLKYDSETTAANLAGEIIKGYEWRRTKRTG